MMEGGRKEGRRRRSDVEAPPSPSSTSSSCSSSTHLVRWRRSPRQTRPAGGSAGGGSVRGSERSQGGDGNDSSRRPQRQPPSASSSRASCCPPPLKCRISLSYSPPPSGATPASPCLRRTLRCRGGRRFILSSVCMVSLAAVAVPLALVHRQRLLAPSAAHRSSSPQWFLGAATQLLAAFEEDQQRGGGPLRRRRCCVALPWRGLLSNNATSSSSSSADSSSLGLVRLPRRPLRRTKSRPDFGRLSIRRLPPDEPSSPSPSYARTIDEERDGARHGEERADRLWEMDEGADPDDFSRSEPGRYDHYDDFSWPVPSGCYRPKWSYEVRPTCNAFHEAALERGLGLPPDAAAGSAGGGEPDGGFGVGTLPGRPLGVGHYRLSWLVSELPPKPASPSSGRRAEEGSLGDFVLKLLRLNESRNFNHKTFSEIQVEALAFAVTTASRRTSDIYGHCGTSLAVERGTPVDETIRPDREFVDPDDFDELSRSGGGIPLSANPYAPEEKLEMALAMAESLADLHGNPRGAIVNNDVKIDQWIMTPAGYKLNDINKGRILRWSPGRRRYCTVYSSYDTVYRAPEELEGDHVDESPDVYALGKVLYTLLTGRQPHFERGSKRGALAAIREGTPPWIDPRFREGTSSGEGGGAAAATAIERSLVKVMERCWAHRPEDRPSVFEVVGWLREIAAGAAAAESPGAP